MSVCVSQCKLIVDVSQCQSMLVSFSQCFKVKALDFIKEIITWIKSLMFFLPQKRWKLNIKYPEKNLD